MRDIMHFNLTGISRIDDRPLVKLELGTPQWGVQDLVSVLFFPRPRPRNSTFYFDVIDDKVNVYHKQIDSSLITTR